MLFVFLAPIWRANSKKKLALMYLVYLGVAVIETITWLLFYKLRFPVVIYASLIAPIIEEIFKLKMMPVVAQRKPYFTVAWGLAGMESLLYYFALIQMKTFKKKIDGLEDGPWDAARNIIEIYALRAPSVFMHLLTCYIIWRFMKSTRSVWIGVLIAIIIHGVFNYIV